MEQKNTVKKYKGGRPKKPIKKEQVLHVKCSSLEKTIIKGKARSASISVSQYMREIALTGKIDSKTKALPKEILKCFALLHNTASNINQITKKLNSTGNLTPFLNDQLQFHLGELEKTEEKIKSWFQ